MELQNLSSQTYKLNHLFCDRPLVVEVADSTLRFDRSVKARLYAHAGIVEYWVYDVNGERLIVYLDPRDGEYQSIQAYGKDESVAPLAAPDSHCRVGDLLPSFAG